MCIISSGSFSQTIHSTAVDTPSFSFDTLPDELLPEIFSHLHVVDQVQSMQVCRRWNQLVRVAQDNVWIPFARNSEDRKLLQSIAFGNKQALQYFGKDAVDGDDMATLSKNILEEGRRPCHILAGQRVMDSHDLVYMPAITLETVCELSKKFFPSNEFECQYLDKEVLKKYGKIPMISGWRWMLKVALPKSENKSFDIQAQMVRDLNARIAESLGSSGTIRFIYEISSCTELAYFHLQQYVRTQGHTRLFECKYFRCCDDISGLKICIGSLVPIGLQVRYVRHCFHSIHLGLAVTRPAGRFPPIDN